MVASVDVGAMYRAPTGGCGRIGRFMSAVSADAFYDAKALRGAQGFRSGGEEYGLVLTVALFHGVAEEELVVDVLLGGDEGGLGKLLVVAGYFDLLAVLGDFLEVVVERSEFLELFLKVVLHLAGDLVGALGDDANGFIDVAGVFGELNQVACDGVEGGVCLLVVHEFIFRCRFRY